MGSVAPTVPRPGARLEPVSSPPAASIGAVHAPRAMRFSARVAVLGVRPARNLRSRSRHSFERASWPETVIRTVGVPETAGSYRRERRGFCRAARCATTVSCEAQRHLVQRLRWRWGTQRHHSDPAIAETVRSHNAIHVNWRLRQTRQKLQRAHSALARAEDRN